MGCVWIALNARYSGESKIDVEHNMVSRTENDRQIVGSPAMLILGM